MYNNIEIIFNIFIENSSFNYKNLFAFGSTNKGLRKNLLMKSFTINLQALNFNIYSFKIINIIKKELKIFKSVIRVIKKIN